MALRTTGTVAAATLATLMSAASAAPPPIEAYGELPAVRSMTISPDGTRVAFLNRSGGKEALVVADLAKGPLGGMFTDTVKARWVDFADDDHVILGASMTTTMNGRTDKFEYSGAYSYSVSAKKAVRLLADEPSVYFAQGIGRIVGYLEEKDRDKTVRRALMPAYVQKTGYDPRLGLYKVNLDTGGGELIAEGTATTRDWIVDQNGKIIARMEFDDKLDSYRMQVKRDNQWESIIAAKSTAPVYFFEALGGDGASIIVSENAEDGREGGLKQMSLQTGALTNLPEERKDRDIDAALEDSRGVFIGVAYSGMYPEYSFRDKSMSSSIAAAQAKFPDTSVALVSASDDFNKLIVKVEGSTQSGRYYLFDRAANKMTGLAENYPLIKADQVGPVLSIQYKARDGLVIPAVLTLPPGGATKGLPTIALPHGGPEAYDSVSFDWLAQYFASRGYMVLQPNFRGSTGFGVEFRDAGRGEWGRKMQDDVTDGVNALIKAGRADPNRICILGASYGGYAALAGGAFTPDLYKCVVAIAGVSDIPAMLRSEVKDAGSKSWVVAYWKRVIGDPEKEKAKLESISPSNSAAAFKAPVLLIHGKDDTVVPIRQSDIMEAALKKAGKPVEFIRLKGEDHWLSGSDTRLATLKAAADFVDRHIGSAPAAPK